MTQAKSESENVKEPLWVRNHAINQQFFDAFFDDVYMTNRENFPFLNSIEKFPFLFVKSFYIQETLSFQT